MKKVDNKVTFFSLAGVFWLAAFSCGNPALVRRLVPEHPEKIKIVKKDRSFAVTGDRVHITLSLLDRDEINKLTEKENDSFGYDYSYRQPSVTVFKVKYKNLSDSKLFCNPYSIRLVGRAPGDEKVILESYTRYSFKERFSSQTYARYSYKRLTGRPSKESTHPLYRYLVDPKKEKSYYIVFPMLSEQAEHYNFEFSVRDALKPDSIEQVIVGFHYQIERES